jgi:hypothetical protein
MNAAALYFGVEFPESKTILSISIQDKNYRDFKALRYFDKFWI